jgi:Spy/CpxP family protein refolding chaperone
MTTDMKDGAIMKKQNRARTKWIVGAALFALLGMSTQARAQDPSQQQNPVEPAQSQPMQADQMLGPLNLTQEQIDKIKEINKELRDERQAAAQRLSLAKQALNEAVKSPNPNEKSIEQRSKEFADAQANAIRLRSLTQARILQVLTPQQRIKLRMMQQFNQARMREQNRTQRPGANRLPRIFGGRQNGLQRNSNTNVPLTPKQRRIMRQQQRP